MHTTTAMMVLGSGCFALQHSAMWSLHNGTVMNGWATLTFDMGDLGQIAANYKLGIRVCCAMHIWQCDDNICCAIAVIVILIDCTADDMELVASIGLHSVNLPLAFKSHSSDCGIDYHCFKFSPVPAW